MQISTGFKKKAFFVFLPSALVMAAAAVFLFTRNAETPRSSTGEARTRYEKFLAEHPYRKTERRAEKEGEKEPKTDRPDLAMRQDFLRTLDPALGYVPTERLAAVHALIRSQQKNKAPLSSYNWTERGPDNVGGRSRAIMFDPNDATGKKVWTGGVGGGLWYCNDITLPTPVWNKVNDLWDNIAVTTIAYDPTNPQIFYAGTGEGWYNLDAIRGAGIWKTTDGGATWSQLSSTTGFEFFFIQKIAVDPATGDVYAGTRQDGLRRSQNKGATWTKVLGSGAGGFSNSVADIEIGTDNTVYASFGIYGTDGIYSSPTGNLNSWTKISDNTGFPSFGYARIELATAPSDANVVYALAEDENTRDVLGIYRSANKGATWTSLSLPVDLDNGVTPSFSRSQAWYDLSMAVDPSSSNTIIVGGVDLFKTTNAGGSWQQLSHWYGGFGKPYVHADQHAVVFRPGSSTTAVFANDGGIFYSSNLSSASPSFAAKNTGYNVTQFYSCAMHPSASSDYFLAGSQDNGTQQFTSPGINSTNEAYGGDGAYCFIDQDNPSFQIVSYVYNHYYLSDDGGQNFYIPLVEDDQTGSFINAADYDDRENILFAHATTSSIMRIVDVTGAFYRDDFSANLGGEASALKASPYAPANTSTLFVGTDGGRLFKITNAHSASPVVNEITGSNFPIGTISCVEIGASENDLLVTFSNYGLTSVWRSTNGGSTWSGREGNLPDMPVRWALFNPNNNKEVMLATQVGIWATSDITVSSPSWTTSSGFPNTRVDMLQVRSSDKLVIAATHGRGLFSTDGFSNTAPSANFSVSSSNVCGTSAVTFSNTSSGTVSSYSWNFGSGASPATASTAGPHSVSYSTSGTKTIRLIVTGSNGTDSITKTVTVNPSPALSVAVNSYPTCNGSNNGSATATALGGTSFYTYSWPGGTGATRTNLTAGTYVVTVTDGAGCSKTASVTLTQPSAIGTTMTKTNATCGQNDGIATAIASGGSGSYSYVWSNSATGSTVTGLAPGFYMVTVTDGTGCTHTNSVTIANTTTLATNAGTNATICNGESVAIGGSPSASGGAGSYSYAWSPASSLSASNVANPVASPSATTTYTLTVTDGAGCAVNDAVVVTVKPDMNPAFTQSADTVPVNSTVTFTATGTGVTSWSWKFGDGGTSASQNPGHSYAQEGMYYTELVTSNGTCSDTLQDSILVVKTNSISDAKGIRQIALYPNPVSRTLTVQLTGAGAGRLSLMNTAGQSVWSKDKPADTEKVDVSGLAEGVYLMQIETRSGTLVRKVTIQR